MASEDPIKDMIERIQKSVVAREYQAPLIYPAGFFDDDSQDADLTDPILNPTIDQIRCDLLEAREDIKSGLVYSLDDVYAEMDRAFAAARK
jgi:hypothetical protein